MTIEQESYRNLGQLSMPSQQITPGEGVLLSDLALEDTHFQSSHGLPSKWVEVLLAGKQVIQSLDLVLCDLQRLSCCNQ